MLSGKLTMEANPTNSGSTPGSGSLDLGVEVQSVEACQCMDSQRQLSQEVSYIHANRHEDAEYYERYDKQL